MKFKRRNKRMQPDYSKYDKKFDEWIKRAAFEGESLFDCYKRLEKNDPHGAFDSGISIENFLKEISSQEKEYEIPVIWRAYGTMMIKADSLEEAIKEVETNPTLEWPVQDEVVEGSLRVNRQVAEEINKDK